MSKLSYHERKELPEREFVFEKSRKFPIEDESHARNALSRAGAKGGSVEEAVRREVHRRYPGIKMEKK